MKGSSANLVARLAGFGKDCAMTATRTDALTGDLAELLATEERLERRLAEARVEAARLVEAARESAGRREAHLEQELAALGRRLEADAQAERGRRLEEVETAAREAADRFDRIPDGRIADLARAVAALVAGDLPP